MRATWRVNLDTQERNQENKEGGRVLLGTSRAASFLMVPILSTFFFFFLKWTSTDTVKERKVAQSCLSLCNPMDYSLLGSSVHGTFQARILESVAISFCSRSS